MSKVYTIGDLHFHHQKVLNFGGGREGSNVDEHNEILIQKWNSVVKKRDLVYVVGDICMKNPDGLNIMSRLIGRKILVRGNHDRYWNTREYLQYVDEIHGMIKYKRHWITHCPIHPQELFGKNNVHGHVHTNTVLDENGKRDDRYINVCVEACNGVPVLFDDIISGSYQQTRKY